MCRTWRPGNSRDHEAVLFNWSYYLLSKRGPNEIMILNQMWPWRSRPINHRSNPSFLHRLAEFDCSSFNQRWFIWLTYIFYGRPDRQRHATTMPEGQNRPRLTNLVSNRLIYNCTHTRLHTINIWWIVINLHLNWFFNQLTLKSHPIGLYLRIQYPYKIYRKDIYQGIYSLTFVKTCYNIFFIHWEIRIT